MGELHRSGRFLPYNSNLKQRARELRKNMTPAERKLWQYLRQLPVRILRQRPIDHFIVDFYCPSRKIVIEVDGESHNSPEVIARDQERTQHLEGHGLTVIRITNQAIADNFNSVCQYCQQSLTHP